MRMGFRWVGLLLSVLGCSLVCTAAHAAPRMDAPRVALVIGNSAYTGVWPDLQGGPLRDAQLMKQVLTRLNFTVVYRENADLQQMLQALLEFRKLLDRKETRRRWPSCTSPGMARRPLSPAVAQAGEGAARSKIF